MDPKQVRLMYAVASAAAVGLVTIVCVRTALLSSRPTPRAPPASLAPLARIASLLGASRDAMAERLAAALRLRTISYETAEGNAASLLEKKDGEASQKSCGGCVCCVSPATRTTTQDACTSPTLEALNESRSAFVAFHKHLQTSFPLIHTVLERHVVNRYSLVYVWRPVGVEFNARPAVALAAHLDVVPVPDAADWIHPPFAGCIADGFINGRGAIDDKHSVLTICEAVEAMLAVGTKPTRPILLAFGHDEEIGGFDGAAAIAKEVPRLLSASCTGGGRPLSFLLDEGLFLLRGIVPGVSRRVALICTREKGHVNVELKVEAKAGHSSVPGQNSAIGRLAAAVTAVERAGSHAPLYDEPAFGLLRALAPDLPLLVRTVIANAWLFAPLLRFSLLSGGNATAALLRSTTAVTMTAGGIKSNVLPPVATALVNHRVHPAETVADVVQRDRAAVGKGVSIRAFEELEPAPVSRATGAPGWEAVCDAIAAVFPDAAVAQGLMLANTDTRHFWALADDIYRHCPVSITLTETAMFHGKDEKIAVDQLPNLATFYAAVLLSSACG